MTSSVHDHSNFNPNGGSYLCIADLADVTHIFFFSYSGLDKEIEIKRTVDALAAVVAPIFVEYHFETILDGSLLILILLLPPFCLEPIHYKVEEIEALLFFYQQ